MTEAGGDSDEYDCRRCLWPCKASDLIPSMATLAVAARVEWQATCRRNSSRPGAMSGGLPVARSEGGCGKKQVTEQGDVEEKRHAKLLRDRGVSCRLMGCSSAWPPSTPCVRALLVDQGVMADRQDWQNQGEKKTCPLGFDFRCVCAGKRLASLEALDVQQSSRQQTRWTDVD